MKHPLARSVRRGSYDLEPRLTFKFDIILKMLFLPTSLGLCACGGGLTPNQFVEDLPSQYQDAGSIPLADGGTSTPLPDGGTESPDGGVTPPPPTPPPPAVSQMLFRIQGIKSDKGHVMCALFNGATGFPSDPSKSISSNRVSAVVGTVDCTFLGFPEGDYALSFFHDINDDLKLNTGLFDAPVEPYGASNDARKPFGPPTWKDARFHFDGSQFSQTVTAH